jgi:CRISPR-associated protein Cst2
VSSPVFEIAILARAKWNLHSLNNEGTVGNVSEPRTVVLWDGTKSDAVSGEMLKHIHAGNVWLLATDKSIFCEPCRVLQPQRAEVNDNVGEAAKKSKNDAAKVLDVALGDCALCDLHGFLRTKPSIPRSSTIEFGWAVAVRDTYHRDHHIHARHVVEGRTVEESSEGESRGAAAQMVYHRPTRSGVYALVTVFQPWRIGLNEVNYRYVAGVEREGRYRLGLEAYKALFARTNGAMTSTRLPHVEEVEGVVVASTRNFPVPVPSPLNDGYRDAVTKLVAASEGLEARPFASLPEFYTAVNDLGSRTPFVLATASASAKKK